MARVIQVAGYQVTNEYCIPPRIEWADKSPNQIAGDVFEVFQFLATKHVGKLFTNTNYQSTAKRTPFEVVYGRTPPSLAWFILGETKVEAVAKDLTNRDEALKQLKYHLNRVQGQRRNLLLKAKNPLKFK